MTKTLSGKQWLVATIAVLCVLAALAWHQMSSRSASERYGSLTLLIPDSMATDAPEVRIWTEAAAERGVLLTPLSITTWMRGVNYGAEAARQAVIIPDTFHRRISEAAAQTLVDVVHAGGKAMVVQDAGLLDERGYYSHGQARFSAMLGVRYGDYDQYKENLSDYDEIMGSASTMQALGIPPGRYLSAKAAASLTSIAASDLARTDPEFVTFVAGYTKDSQRFAVLKTDRPTAPRILLQSADGNVVASIHRWGQGQAMFVNLPLTYLLERTDGIFLHGFLTYFSSELAQQAQRLQGRNRHAVAHPAIDHLRLHRNHLGPQRLQGRRRCVGHGGVPAVSVGQ